MECEGVRQIAVRHNIMPADFGCNIARSCVLHYVVIYQYTIYELLYYHCDCTVLLLHQTAVYHVYFILFIAFLGTVLGY